MLKRIGFLFVGIFCLLLYSCNNGSGGGAQTEETKQMVAELKKLVDDGMPMYYYHWNSKMAAALKQQMESAPAEQKEQIWFQYCMQTIFAGDNKTAISELEKKITISNCREFDCAKSGNL